MISLNSYNVKGLAYIGFFITTAICMEINIVMMVLVGLKALTIELAEIILNFGGTLLLHALDVGRFSDFVHKHASVKEMALKTRTSNHAGFAMLVWIFYTETIFLFAKRRMAKILI